MIQVLSDFNSFIWNIIGIFIGFPLAVSCIIGAIFTICTIIGSIFHFIYKGILGIRNGK